MLEFQNSLMKFILLRNGGHLDQEIITEWEDRLRNGVIKGGIRLPPCPYDEQNLHYSWLFLIGSLHWKYKYQIIEELGPSPSGLQVFVYLIKTRLLYALDKQRNLIKQLENLKIVDEPAEDVRTFNVKVRDLCKEIEQTGPSPCDLAFIVATCYITSEVSLFSTKMLEICLKIQVEWSAIKSLNYLFRFRKILDTCLQWESSKEWIQEGI